MDDVLDDLLKIVRRSERVAKAFDAVPVGPIVERLLDAGGSLESCWSGSWIGYQSAVYIAGFQQPGYGEFFDPQYGLQEAWGNKTSGNWRHYEYDEVKREILRRAGASEGDIDLIAQARDDAGKAFDELRDDLLPTLDALIDLHGDDRLRKLRDQAAGLGKFHSREEFAKALMPRKNFITNDYLAINQGFMVSPHKSFVLWIAEMKSYGAQVQELGRIARHSQRYLEAKYKMKGRTIAKKDGKIFIGHGRSMAWRDLKDFLHETLGLPYDEFNREEAAGKSNKERLEEMLDAASFAFLVLTAEDEHTDGTVHARENVIHEAGLFQGRLGFEKAIILLEEGCAEFSNKAGLTHISFPKGRIMAASERVRAVLKREGII